MGLRSRARKAPILTRDTRGSLPIDPFAEMP